MYGRNHIPMVRKVVMFGQCILRDGWVVLVVICTEPTLHSVIPRL